MTGNMSIFEIRNICLSLLASYITLFKSFDFIDIFDFSDSGVNLSEKEVINNQSAGNDEM